MSPDTSKRVPKLVRLVQFLVLSSAIFGGAYWGYFSVSAIAWIVPPDHSEDLVRAHSAVAMDAMWMVHVSMALIVASLMLSRAPYLALALCVLALGWSSFYQLTATVHGFPDLERYRQPVTIAYIAIAVVLATVLIGGLRLGFLKGKGGGW